MADANLVLMSYVEEATSGTTPTSPALTDLRMTGESLKADTQTALSDEIVSDRMTSDVSRTGISASGDINFELSYGSQDELFRYLLMDDAWSSANSVSSHTVNWAIADNSITRTSGNWGAGLPLGAWIRISNAATAAHNGYWCIVELINIDKFRLAGKTVTANDTSDAIDIKCSGHAQVGTTLKTLSILKSFTDVAQYQLFRMMAVDSMQLQCSVGQKVTGSFSFLGRDGLMDVAEPSGATHTVVNTNQVYNGIDHLIGVFEGDLTPGAPTLTTTSEIESFTITANNNLRQRLALGQLGAISIGTGRMETTGNLRAYFSDGTMIGKQLNFNSSSFALVFQDTAGNAMIFHLPYIHYTSSQALASGVNQDVFLELDFAASKSPVTGQQLTVTRIAA